MSASISEAYDMDLRAHAESAHRLQCARRTHATVLAELGSLAWDAKERLVDPRTYAHNRMDRGTVHDFAYLVRCLMDELEGL